MTPLPVEKMTEEQLWAGLRGAMAWQQIVQKRNGGPEDCREAAVITGLYAKALNDKNRP
jgi:hypothetical protein